MSALYPTLEAFFTERLIGQRHASPNTVAAYRDTWRLLLRFVHDNSGKEPHQLDLADLDADVIGAFLDHLESKRHNSVRTRNARLCGIRSFFSYASLRHPEHAALIARVLAIPTKRCEQKEISYLDTQQLAALLNAPDLGTWTGRRDHALLEVAVATGLRVSELTGLRNSDVQLGTGANVSCTGKGRKARCTPMAKNTVEVLGAWMRERGGEPDDPLFPTRRGTPLNRGAVARLVARHASTATRQCPSLRAKHLTPHVLRHSCRDGDAPLKRGCGSDRAVARPLADRDHEKDLYPRGPLDQRTRPRPHRSPQHQAGSLPTLGPAPRVPRQPLSYATTADQHRLIRTRSATPQDIIDSGPYLLPTFRRLRRAFLGNFYSPLLPRCAIRSDSASSSLSRARRRWASSNQGP